MKRINILITDEQHKKLSERAKKHEVSISQQIRQAIDRIILSLPGLYPDKDKK